MLTLFEFDMCFFWKSYECAPCHGLRLITRCNRDELHCTTFAIIYSGATSAAVVGSSGSCVDHCHYDDAEKYPNK